MIGSLFEGLTMTSSPAQLAANRQNAARSTGPRSAIGKERSRRNSLKHGLTGAGIVLPHEDEAAIEARFAEFEADLRPRGGVNRFLVRRAALLSVRLDRSAIHEASRLSTEILNVQAQRSDHRSDEVNRLIGEIANAPSRIRGELIARPDGVDGLAEALRTLRGEIGTTSAEAWNPNHGPRLDALLGRDPGGPTWRSGQLANAVGGDFAQLKPGEAAELDDLATRSWARDRLVDLIDAEIRKLEYSRSMLPPIATGFAFESEPDPASDHATGLALFDTSKDAILARQYEATTERNRLRTLREVCRTSPQVPVEPEDPDERDEEFDDELGSFFPEPRRVDPGAPRRRRRPIPGGLPPLNPPGSPDPVRSGRLPSVPTGPPTMA